MPINVNDTFWDQKSGYHAKREECTEGQVRRFLLPHILEHIQKESTGSISICDFACGAGAVTENVIYLAQKKQVVIEKVMLVDVVTDNLEVALKRLKEKFPEIPVSYFKCNGRDFKDYTDKKSDFLYCWDAMVHFDIIDITNYLCTLNQICTKTALFHHSNLGQVTTDIRENPNWRNFMTKDTFAQIAISAGHKVTWQQQINWGKTENLDCITRLSIAG